MKTFLSKIVAYFQIFQNEILSPTTTRAKFLIRHLGVFILAIMLTSKAQAEDFDVQLNPSLYAGGYNISCHGANNGSINLFISGGTSPYTFVWLDGPTTRNRTNLTAGYYRVTVTASNGSIIVREITLSEPENFVAVLLPEEHSGGYNISENGGSDGNIKSEIHGGVPPYTFLWSNGETTENIEGLTSGVYSLTVHDATNCSAIASITLNEPTLLHIVSISSPTIGNSNFNTSCGAYNGSINLQVAGGTPPYTFDWSSGSFAQNPSGLRAGTYTVKIRDENRVEIDGSITLTSSPNLSAVISPFIYSNGKNTSCFSCNNGNITISNLIGVAPYTFNWNNGQTSQNATNLSAGNYSVMISDATGCSLIKEASIIAPEREAWNMNGNGNITSNQFIGTTDNNDLIFKRNNSESIRITNASTKISNLLDAEGGITLNSSSTFKITYDSTALRKSIFYGRIFPVISCPSLNTGATDPFHTFDGFVTTRTLNSDVNAGINIGILPSNGTGLIELEGTDNLQNPDNVLLINYFCGRNTCINTNNQAGINGGWVMMGEQVHMAKHLEIGDVNWGINNSPNNIALDINVNDGKGIRLKTWNNTVKLINIENTSNVNDGFIVYGDGTTQIGAKRPTGNHTDAKLSVQGKIVAQSLFITKPETWADLVFDRNYKLLPLNELEKFYLQYHHLPEIQSETEVKENGYNVTELNVTLLKKVEELSLYVVALQKQIDAIKNK